MPQRRPAPAWLADAVIYQIYPQSFADSDGDGIGDLPGITSRLDHLAWLGVNTVWISPFFASEFGDGGYDITDHLRVAPRYGTDDDALALVEAARERGIRVMLDLVPGHTSHLHPWFRHSAATPGDDRYIWSERLAPPTGEWVPNLGGRGGYYRTNFYPIQPALNYGYARPDPGEPWRQPVDAPGPTANRQALRDIMTHWFERGVSGFRVDMAASLVKDDPGHEATSALWGEMRDWLDTAYPDRVLLSEWGDPKTSVPAGVHADFFLHFQGLALRSLWDNGTGSQGAWEHLDACYFDPEGRGGMGRFLAAWSEADAAVAGRGHVALPTANHDFSRLVCGPRTREQAGPAFAFQLTWPSLPVIYYGDEIGMRYLPGLPDTEGSQLGGEARQGSRTPMQWDDGPSAGFSSAAPEDLYLPLDPAPDRPSVAAARADERSLLHQVRALIALRAQNEALGAGTGVRVLHDGYPLVYLRGGTHVVVVNPRREPATWTRTADLGEGPLLPLLTRGVEAGADTVTAAGHAYAVYALPLGS
ncbi:alpha-amylase family glycosyl hydrolase [Streptomyces fuscigenes]|uniref:alpha-amylase family glycosyl hydrolase n=1 Tax=Streptomyces fuscigenes TaxID=1528880 RepID=UPI001EE9E762|nr:alpha-amylase family glycosyl hydrolase [Streptomyces fuscigenes]MCF3963364.1 oligo-1,6-glucosidase [Streptomyces fuscigenes]